MGPDVGELPAVQWEQTAVQWEQTAVFCVGTAAGPSWRSFAPWRWRAYGRRSDRLFVCISRKLLEWEGRYNTVEKECPAIWWPSALLPYVRIMPATGGGAGLFPLCVALSHDTEAPVC